MAVDLEFGTFGAPGHPPLLILHGLLGSSRNWLSVGKVLSQWFNVFLIDLRNHGSSPHAESMLFDEMVNDLEEWVNTKAIDKFYLLGHSLGGKVAMAYACKNPNRLRGLIVEDIAPKEYPLRYEAELDAMHSVNLGRIQTRVDADRKLAETIHDWEWRQFLLTNLIRDKNGAYKWQVNLPVLRRDLRIMMKNSLCETDKYTGPTLFLRGERADFIADDDYDVIKRHFKRFSILKIPNAGHNIHIDNQTALIDALHRFEEHVDHKVAH